MTVPTIRVKVVRKPLIKGKMDVRFPANVAVDEFLTVVKANGTYTFGVDYTLLGEFSSLDPAAAKIAFLDADTGAYQLINIADIFTSTLDPDLQAIAALAGTGLLVRTGTNAWSVRTLTAPAAGITITNPAGIAGNPTLVLANDLAALEGLSGTGIARRTGTDAWSVGTAVANSELATMLNNTFKGNVSGSTAVPSDLTAAQVTAALPLVTTSAKGLAPTLPNDATKYLDGTGAYSIPPGGVTQVYDTRTAVQAATIPGSVNQIQTTGYATIGDGGGSIATDAVYKRVGSLPGHSGYIQSADGAYWELTGPWVSVRQFGAVAAVANIDTDPDCAAAINLCMAYCNLKQTNMLIPSGQWPLDSAITSPTFIIHISGSQGDGQPTVLYKRYVEASSNLGIISLGAWGATVSDIQFAAKTGSSGGSGFSAILPNNAANIGILRLRNIYVSCGDGVNNSLYINGTVNTGGAGGTGGHSYRSAFLENCHFFGAAQYTVVLLGVRHLFASNIYSDSTGGTTSSGYVMNLAGASSSGNDDIFWNGIIAGALNLDNLTRAVFNCVVSGNIDNSANVDGVTVDRCSGTVGTAWTNSGVVNSGAWTTSSPVPTSSSGTLTAASSTVAYKKVGKTVHCEGSVTVTTLGTGGGSLNVQLPFTLVRAVTFAGKENAANGLAFVASVTTAGVLGILKYDNTTHLTGNGLVFPFSFTAEAA
ncbi:hypothetical protein BKD09_24030 [Bradyrhizobium japonicum]|uniref:Uncharacterized protein n=1 Tax=Bradyrhizobium japonicum TaxID=375 RepID=A0A1L3FDL3_BRAJP|nr:hypothetical protein [Bradyrhizobium japonicum]APG11407.1 hypothetical protein BKD09_24030 [Bradyrhizobium japonicum]